MKQFRPLLFIFMLILPFIVGAGILFAQQDQGEDIDRERAIEALAVLEAYVYQEPMPSPTAIPTATPLPSSTPRHAPTPYPTATPTPTPTSEPIPWLDCEDGEYDPYYDLPISGVTMHMDMAVINPASPTHGQQFWFSIVEDYEVREGIARKVEGFQVVVANNKRWYLYKMPANHAETGDQPSLLHSGRLGDIPFDSAGGAENRITFFTRDSEVDEYRFYVNGYKVPVDFSQLTTIMSKPHQQYGDKYYSFSQDYQSDKEQIFRRGRLCLELP